MTDFDFEGEIGLKTEDEIEETLDTNLINQGVVIQNKTVYGVLWRCLKIGAIAVFIAFQKLLVVVAKNSNWMTAEGSWLKLMAPAYGVTDTEGKDDEEIRAEGTAKSGREGVWKAGLVYKVIINEVTGISLDYIYVDDDHPRGQGTVDIYLTDELGLPEQSVLDAAYDYVVVQGNRGIGDNVQVMFPPLKTIDIHLKIVLWDDEGDEDDIDALARAVVKAKFRESTDYMDSNSNGRVVERVHVAKDLVRSELSTDLDLLGAPKKEILILSPSATVTVGHELPVLGELTIDMVRESDDN